MAFAHVNLDGTLDAANSKNVIAARKVVTGLYCLDVTPSFQLLPRNVVAQIDELGANPGDTISATVAPAAVAQICASTDDEAAIFTINNSGSLSDSPFYVVFN